ncbi:ATP-binding protein [Desulfobacterales bacterium HSG16]|nr:ATP-binding protein [Desulfobacterales bacterium HSG16]
MKKLSDISLKNKIFFSTLFVIMMISAVIALLSRWILVSSLTSELELRGTAIAHSIAERGSGYVLDKNIPMLLTLIFDEARLRERYRLISYIFITDEHDDVLSHTFTRPFPRNLQNANKVTADVSNSVQLVHMGNQSAYDIAVPMKEGLYLIGAVHVGLSKEHIDNLVSKLRFTFLGFISLVIIIIFIISHWLSRYISMPLAKLTKMSDDLSRGKFDINLDPGEYKWKPTDCPAYEGPDHLCWRPNETLDLPTDIPDENQACLNCVDYRRRKGDEVIQLTDSFKNMVRGIKFYRRRLRESEEKYRSLFDNGPDPIFVVSCSTFRIVDANPRALEVYCYTKKELIGTSFSDLGPEHDNECFAIFDDIALQSNCVYYPKMAHYKKGRNQFFVSVNACPISYKTEPAIIIATTDITEMIEKDAQLIQASKMKTLGEMSAGIAHELNQPLNAIKLGSDFLSMAKENDLDIPKDQLYEVVTEISSQVDRASEIINTLRSFGRKADPVKEKLDLNNSIKGVLSIVGRQFELQNIEFRLDLSENLTLILAQDNRLQQVFFNLVTNARDSINEKGVLKSEDRVITIRTGHEDNKVIAAVSDTGNGIPEAVKEKIFEPFFTTKKTGQDMGLGLAITYGIIKDYRGEIQIESTRGVGTTFKLIFPKAA